MTTITKNFEIDKSRILCDLDQLLKLDTRNLRFGFKQTIFARSKKFCMFEFDLNDNILQTLNFQ